MDGPKTVQGEFIRFKFGKVSGRNLKKGRALLQVTVTGRGVVVVFGKKVKKLVKKAGQAEGQGQGRRPARLSKALF